MIAILQAESPRHVAEAQRLFREYAQRVGDDRCFQNFQRELLSLPGQYAPPRGRLLLALDSAHALEDGTAAGCVALRPISGESCEMKRLYVRPQFRGTGLGRCLVASIMAEARKVGYSRIRLDTLPSMKTAIGLYRSTGFRPTKPFNVHPVAGALFMEADLGARIRAESAESNEQAQLGAPGET